MIVDIVPIMLYARSGLIVKLFIKDCHLEGRVVIKGSLRCAL